MKLAVVIVSFPLLVDVRRHESACGRRLFANVRRMRQIVKWNWIPYFFPLENYMQYACDKVKKNAGNHKMAICYKGKDDGRCVFTHAFVYTCITWTGGRTFWWTCWRVKVFSPHTQLRFYDEISFGSFFFLAIKCIGKARKKKKYVEFVFL